MHLDKNARNIRERGFSFERVSDFEFDTALFWKNNRHDYGEDRIIGLGLLDGRVHALVFKHVGVDRIRLISFRKANRREIKRYEQETGLRNG